LAPRRIRWLLYIGPLLLLHLLAMQEAGAAPGVQRALPVPAVLWVPPLRQALGMRRTSRMMLAFPLALKISMGRSHQASPLERYLQAPWVPPLRQALGMRSTSRKMLAFPLALTISMGRRHQASPLKRHIQAPPLEHRRWSPRRRRHLHTPLLLLSFFLVLHSCHRRILQFPFGRRFFLPPCRWRQCCLRRIPLSWPPGLGMALHQCTSPSTCL